MEQIAIRLSNRLESTEIKPFVDAEENTLLKSNFNYYIDFVVNEDALINKEDIKLNVRDKAKFDKNSVDFKAYSKFALVFYIIAVILTILFFVFKNNNLDALKNAALELLIISALLYLLYFVRSHFNFTKLYKIINENMRSKNVIFLVLSIVFYPLAFFLRRNKIEDDFRGILK